MSWPDGSYITHRGAIWHHERIKRTVRWTSKNWVVIDAVAIDLMEQLSRVVSGHEGGPKKDFYSATHTSTFKVSGRHVLNVWRICRSEFNLTQYSFENVVFHLLHQRCVRNHSVRPGADPTSVPHYSAASLTALWKSKSPTHTLKVLKYFFQRVVICMEVIDRAEIITKNA